MANKPKVTTIPNTKRVKFNCVACNKEKIIFRSQAPEGPKFCSRVCFGKQVKEEKRTCGFCNTAFIVFSNNKTKRFCSKSCSNKGRAVKEIPIPKEIPKPKEAKFITDNDIEQSLCLKKSGAYKIKCLTCNKVVIRYISRGRACPSYCSKKCMRWRQDHALNTVESSEKAIPDITISALPKLEHADYQIKIIAFCATLSFVMTVTNIVLVIRALN